MPDFHFRQPAPINQFFRLEYNEIDRRWEKDAPWNHIHRDSRGNLIDWDSLLCMAAAGAIALDAHTAGRIRTTPGRIHDGQSDNLGGIGVDDVRDAWSRLYGHTLWTPIGMSWTELLAEVKRGRCVIVGVVYDELGPWKAQAGTFDHAMTISDYDDATGYLYVFDSLRAAGIWMSPSYLRRGAEALARRVRGNAGSLFVGLSAARPRLTTAAPHYAATLIRASSLWNDSTKRWVFTGSRAIPAGTKLEVRAVQYRKDGIACYPVTAGKYATAYSGYYVPVRNVKLGGRV
jgi:hypothetical protein